MWTSHDTTLLVWAAVGIAVIIVLVTWLRMHPFPALMIGSLFVGLVAGLGPTDTIASFEKGVGAVLGSVGLILALGTMLGKLLADSGGADRIAATILGRSGPRRIPWAMALIAMIVAIPLFFEIGVVLLIPLIFTVARQLQERARESGDAGAPDPAGGGGLATRVAATTRRTTGPYLLVGIPALAGLSVLHGLIPPHPGPLIAIAALKADLGTTLLAGLCVAVPTVIIAGPIFGTYISKRVHAEPSAELREQVAREVRLDEAPSFVTTVATVLLPVVLMLVRTFADIFITNEDNTVRTWCDFVGDPTIALLAAVLVATVTFGVRRGATLTRVRELVTSGLAPAATILLIIGAGGGFKQILIDSGVGDTLAKVANHTSLSAVVLAWFIAVLIRLATGSATVATITAAGIVAPIVAHDAAVNRPLIALAVGAGSLFFSHVNDAGFWLVKEYFGMSVPETLKSWSVMETIISVVAGGLVIAASAVF
jgi:gluconate:H+ symporter, GntP family